MTHQDCIAILLGSDADPPVRRDAEEHVARCSDCWMVLRLLHELAMRNAPADAERMDNICSAISERRRPRTL